MSIVILIGHVSINVTYGQLQSLLKSDCVVKQRRTKSWLLLSTWSMKELSFTPRYGVCFDLHEKTYLNKNKSLFVIKDIPYYRWKWSKLGLFSDQTAKNPCYLSVTPPSPNTHRMTSWKGAFYPFDSALSCAPWLNSTKLSIPAPRRDSLCLQHEGRILSQR